MSELKLTLNVCLNNMKKKFIKKYNKFTKKQLLATNFYQNSKINEQLNIKENIFALK